MFHESVTIYSLHMDYGTARRGHISEAMRFINTNKLGWFKEDLYHSSCINFYDANKFELKEILELYKPYYQMTESKETDWLHKYQEKHGWKDQMTFDLDNPTITGVMDGVDHTKKCLVIHYVDTMNVPDYEGNCHDMDKYVNEDDTFIWTESEAIISAVHAANLPEFMWGDVSKQFYPYSNGNKDSGIVQIF